MRAAEQQAQGTTPNAAGIRNGAEWRLSPQRLRKIIAFLEELEHHPVFSKSLHVAGYDRQYAKAMGLLAANQVLLELGLVAAAKAQAFLDGKPASPPDPEGS